jgi:hypothetical protein
MSQIGRPREASFFPASQSAPQVHLISPPARDGQVGLGFQERILGFPSLFRGCAAAAKKSHPKTKNPPAGTSWVGQERNQMELVGQLNESAFPTPEDTIIAMYGPASDSKSPRSAHQCLRRCCKERAKGGLYFQRQSGEESVARNGGPRGRRCLGG